MQVRGYWSLKRRPSSGFLILLVSPATRAISSWCLDSSLVRHEKEKPVWSCHQLEKTPNCSTRWRLLGVSHSVDKRFTIYEPQYQEICFLRCFYPLSIYFSSGRFSRCRFLQLRLPEAQLTIVGLSNVCDRGEGQRWQLLSQNKLD
ncbi:hypothetical protein GALMADRAFT_730917 [Galerina marginata CBS 339.88]|uniref:Uncharacterized protein n=1 Tax=Galerina marginata (strain CBS 339.88) TaxID=685588 RepID=A0A067SQY0_GALM3|nr:hypothetical protein GALMADRAFT_730917 [Galerina marginata CBS 339.88]